MNQQCIRQSFLGPDSDEFLHQVKVGVVGGGGGGSHVIQQLAHVGVGLLIATDPDAVDLTNLNRLVGASYRDSLRGVPKVKVALRLVRNVNPRGKLIPIQRKWQGALAELRECHVLVGCVDSFRERDELERFARQSLIPFIDIGMDVSAYERGYMISGQIALSVPGGICLRCMGIVTEERLAEEANNYGAAGGRPQVVWSNGTLASIAVGLLIQLVLPWHGGKLVPALLEYDGNAHTVEPSNRLLVLSATTCQHHPSNQVGDPFWR